VLANRTEADNASPRMRPKLVRALLTLVTLVVAWLVAPTSAFAMTTRAPVCDPRGAIGFAPHPQLQDPEQTLDVPEASDDCAKSSDDDRLHADRDRGPRGPETASTSDPTIHRSPGVLTSPSSVRVPAPAAAERGARPAHTLALERPPRA
jgi:hypothetical protein